MNPQKLAPLEAEEQWIAKYRSAVGNVTPPQTSRTKFHDLLGECGKKLASLGRLTLGRMTSGTTTKQVQEIRERSGATSALVFPAAGPEEVAPLLDEHQGLSRHAG